MTGEHRIEGTAEELLAEARATTGVDLVDDDAIEPLAILLDAYNTSARFTEGGAVKAVGEGLDAPEPSPAAVTSCMNEVPAGLWHRPHPRRRRGP